MTSVSTMHYPALMLMPPILALLRPLIADASVAIALQCFVQPPCRSAPVPVKLADSPRTLTGADKAGSRRNSCDATCDCMAGFEASILATRPPVRYFVLGRCSGPALQRWKSPLSWQLRSPGRPATGNGREGAAGQILLQGFA